MNPSENHLYWVVEFVKDFTVEVVPRAWLVEETKAYWPCDPKLNKKVKSDLVRSNVNPLEHPRYRWKVFEFRQLVSTDDYEQAERAACRAQDGTDVELTEAEADFTSVNSRTLRPRSSRYAEDRDNLNKTSIHAVEDPALDSLPNLFIPQEPDSLPDATLFSTHEVTEVGLNIDVVPPPACPSSSSTTFMQDLIIPSENILSTASFLTNEQFSELQRENKEYQRVVLREVEKLKRDVEQILQIVQSKHTGGDSVVIVDIPGIPVDTAAGLETLETWLAESDNNSKLILYLRRIGGNDLENFVKRALGKIIGPNLAREINFTGKNGKIAFDSLNLHSCLQSACRKKPTDTDPTDSQIDALVKKWFGGSGDRNGGRNERMKRQNQNTAQRGN